MNELNTGQSEDAATELDERLQNYTMISGGFENDQRRVSTSGFITESRKR
jgi:hypothetical protein